MTAPDNGASGGSALPAGGAESSAGAAALAGAASQGGVAGAGGVANQGGMPSQAGTPAEAGAPTGAAAAGAGGDFGLGGAPLAGRGGGGRIGALGGRGSTAGSAGMAASGDCAERREELLELLSEAQACNPNASRTCVGLVENECGCSVAVASATGTAAREYLEAVDAYTRRCPVACTLVECLDPLGAQCSTATRTCQAVPGFGSN